MNKRNLEELIQNGYISKRKHPKFDLYILNYTPKTQYESNWNEITTQCRGLIVDSDLKIKSRCFKKFFNYEEVKQEVYNRLAKGLSFDVFDKLDGSLGILYWFGDDPYIATRGSFESDQAIRANKILKKYKNFNFKKNTTYLFEIIYPENKICVDYGNEEDLIFLSAFDISSGEEIDVDFPFKKAKKYCSDNNFDDLKSLNLPNKEGFVIRFSDGYRFKIKFSDYVRLHRLIFSISTKSIWNSLRNEDEFSLIGIPDEVFNWIKTTKQRLLDDYSFVESQAKLEFDSFNLIDLSRKEFSQKIKDSTYRGILFKMLDKKPYKDIIWKTIEPEYRTPKDEEI